jgi:hypothetical protein
MIRIGGRLRLLEYTVQKGCSLAPLPEVDPMDQVLTLWITLPPSGAKKRGSRAGLAVSAVALFGCQKDSRFCSWTLWITTLTLRVRHRPSGSAPIDPQGQRVGAKPAPRRIGPDKQAKVGLCHSSRIVQSFCSIRYKCVFVRMKSALPAIAGVAMQPSSSLFEASSFHPLLPGSPTSEFSSWPKR